MAKKTFLKAVLWSLPLPQIGVSLLLEVFAPKRIRHDLDRCVTLVGELGTSVPSSFVDALVTAEDHRNNLHPGIDVIAMVRALWTRVVSGQTQGASTIEQQYVRVVSNRYERTVSRKLREQLLALMLARRVNKQAIASSYLAVAFYGAGCIGIDGIRARFGEDLSTVSFNQALQFVAQLKYPRPLRPDKIWSAKFAARLDVLLTFAEGTASRAPRAMPELLFMVLPHFAQRFKHN